MMSHIFLEGVAYDKSLVAQTSGLMLFPMDDGGFPDVNKEWIDMTVTGRLAPYFDASSSSIAWHYRTNLDNGLYYIDSYATTTYTPTITALPTTEDFYTEFTSRPTGRQLQLVMKLEDPYPGSFEGRFVYPPPEIWSVTLRFRLMPTVKNYYTAVLELSDGAVNSHGSALPDASTQLTNLRAARGATVSLTDPVGAADTVTITDIKILEMLQEGYEYPVLLAQVEMAEI
jgi:hypothetical protein